MALSKIDRTGENYGRLKVICRSLEYKRAYWDCICECGKSTTVRGDHLKEGRVQSCGCIKDEQRTTHGMSRSSEYQCWINMKDRCINPGNREYKNYGARGITVCDAWLESFESFIADMGIKPDMSLTIERTNNDLGYSKDNCCWDTRDNQVRNRRNSLIFTHDGKTLCLKDWCRSLGVSYHNARYRLGRGKTFEQAVDLA